MPDRPPQEARTVFVRLSQVPEKRRVNVAERLCRLGIVTGPEAIAVRAAAYFPRQDPGVWVTPSEARKKTR